MSGQIIADCPLHLSVDTLSAWRDHALPPDDLQRIRDHLPQCPSCEQRLADYDAVARALRRLSVPLPVGGYGRNPRLTGLIARNLPSARRPFHLPTMLETLAAVLVIALLAGVLIHLRSARPVAPTSFATVQLPGARSLPTSILAAPDGTIWFTEPGRGAIGRITPQGGLKEFAMVVSTGDPGHLIIGPDGNVWFNENAASRIGRITPSGIVTEFAVPENAHPHSVAAGADGALWFDDIDSRHIMRLSPTGQLLSEYPIPGPVGGLPVLARGPDGNVWFAVPGTTTIGRMSAGGTATTYQSAVEVDGPLIAGPDGNMWFSAALGTRLGRVDPWGDFASFPSGSALIKAAPLPGTLVDLTAGPDGAVWFALNPPGNAVERPWVGRITRGGAITLTRVPLTGKLGGLTVAPDGTLWLTFNNLDKIGHLTLGG